MKPTPWMLLLLLAACSGGTPDAGEPTPVALVAIAPVESGVLAQHVPLYGAAESGPAGKATLSAPAEGSVVRIVAPAGTRVGVGDVIVQLAPTPTTRLDIAKASADARAADAAYARAGRLRADGLVGNAEVETARAAAASADLTRTSLSGRAGALTLRAPSAGFVEAVAVSPGEVVQPGALVATIARGGDLRARFGADPTVARSLRAGTPLRIGGAAGRAPFAVPIQSIDPIADPTTRLTPVFAKIPAASGIAVGEALTASVAVGADGGGLTIPYAALLDDGGQPYVFVVASGTAHRRDVTVGATDGDRVAITRGVKAGERVVTQGGTAVEDGMKVRTK